jgi:DNA segregation ATPase FtsK/SpoIIIE, S-DNA-T family
MSDDDQHDDGATGGLSQRYEQRPDGARIYTLNAHAERAARVRQARAEALAGQRSASATGSAIAGPGDVIDGDVIDAEIVDDEPPTTALARREPRAPYAYRWWPTPLRAKRPEPRYVFGRRLPQREDTALGFAHTLERLWNAARHDRTKRAAHTGGMVLVDFVSGVVGVLWLLSGGRARSEHRRAFALAEAANDHARMDDLMRQKAARREQRWQRTKERPMVAFRWSLWLLFGCLALGGGLAWYEADWHLIGRPLSWLFWLITTLITLATLSLVATLVALAAGLVAFGRKVRRDWSDAVPKWLTLPEPGGAAVLDEATIVHALANIGIKPLSDLVKNGERLEFVTPPIRDGKGFRCQARLPIGAPVEEIVRRKTVLAHNLNRFPREVWPTEVKDRAGVLDLWVANPGALNGDIGPWPLLARLDTATADYFAGVPVGVKLRGDVVTARLFEANWVVGGMMGSGKSTLVITAVCGAMLDPLVDIDVVVMAENIDYEPMKPRLRTLVTGPEQDSVDAAMALLDEVERDLVVRGKALKEHGSERAVTRKLAERDARLRPRLVVIDECQNLFLNGETKQRKALADRAKQVMMTARKYAVTLMFLTPAPSNDSLPTALIRVASNKACFAIGDQVGNDAVLGTGSYRAGISSVGLEPKSEDGPGDVGTCMTRGFMAKPDLLRCFYIPVSGVEQVTERAIALREAYGVTSAAPTVRAERDLLDDVAQALAGDDVNDTDVVSRLRELAPSYRPYAELNGVRLRAELTAAGVEVPKSRGKYPVRAERVAGAIAERDAEQGGEGDA